MKLIDKVLGEVCAEAIKYACDDKGAQFVINVRTILLPVCEKADAMLRFRKTAEDLGEYAADLDDKLEAVKNLIVKWREEIKEYPDTDVGQYAKVAVGLCSNELEETLGVSDFTTNSEEVEE